ELARETGRNAEAGLVFFVAPASAATDADAAGTRGAGEGAGRAGKCAGGAGEGAGRAGKRAGGAGEGAGRAGNRAGNAIGRGGQGFLLRLDHPGVDDDVDAVVLGEV